MIDKYEGCCGRCWYWDPQHIEERETKPEIPTHGICRRYPPPHNQTLTETWCGEFKPDVK